MNFNLNLKICMLYACFFTTVMLSGQQSMNMTLLGTWDGNISYFSDIWGYTDEQDNEYAIAGSSTRVHFLDITNPGSPVEIFSYAGGANSSWRDFKTYKKYTYAVADAGSEGLLIFDMSGLPNSPPNLVNQITTTNRAHNIYIDVPNGLAYLAGSSAEPNGLIVYDLKTDPANPTVVFSNSLPGGYVHDIFVQDNIAYTSHGFNGFYMYDFSTPSAPQFIDSRSTGGYNHSTWITGDENYIIYAEEIPSGRPMGILDISDIPNNGIELVTTFKFPLLAPQATGTTAHNPFIIGDYAIVSYYQDGVQIFDISDVNNPSPAGWYDTSPNNTTYSGLSNNWGVYPFFPSGKIVASDTENGIFILSTSLNLPTTCNDGIQNGTELGVDCGGFCKPCAGALSANFTEVITNGCTGEVSFSDVSIGGATSWNWDFGDGNSSTMQNPVHSYTNSGVYTISLTVGNSAGTNTITKTNHLMIALPDPPTGTDADFCAPNAVTLSASANTGTINWYDDAGNYLASGPSFTTPSLNSTTTYYIETTTASSQNVGPQDGSIGGGGFHGASAQYLEFTVLQDVTLVSAWVNADFGGNRTVELRDGNGNLINSLTINIPGGTSRIMLNLNLTPGDYQLGGDNMNLFRNNSGPSYPYSIANLIDITGSTAGPDFYYYFYDWEIQAPSCTSAQVPVVATATPAPVSAFTSTLQGSTVSLENNSLNSTSWLWTFGDGNTSTQQAPTHTYVLPGTYTITLTATNDCGSVQFSKTISVPQLQVNLKAFLEGSFNSSTEMMDTKLQQLSLFPVSGQPYSSSPWNYAGTEGVGWQPSDYPVDAVDWVLVSLRSAEDASTTVGTGAGLLLEDGSVSVQIDQLSGSILTAYYIVLEHRNHLPVMSPMLVPVNNNEMTYDFTTADSYVVAGFGQKNIGNNWLLFAGNEEQQSLGHEITGSDIIQWQVLNGSFSIYNESDFNLNGDINGDDKILWSKNNGVFSSVPK